MMSAKLVGLGIFKIKLFWNKGYDIIISVCDVTNKIFLCDSNYIVDVVVWPKFSNSSISMREVTITSFFWGVPSIKFNNLGLALVMALKFYNSVAKGLKLKVKVLGANS